MAIGTIGAILGAVGNAASGVMSIINNRKAQRQQEAEAARQQAYYESKANEDPLSKASNQRLLNQYDRKAKEQIENARNVAAITGATPEFALGVQEKVAEGRSDLMGGIAANAETTQERALEQAELARQNAAKQQQELAAQRNQSYANLAANAASAAGSMMGAMGSNKPASNLDPVALAPTNSAASDATLKNASKLTTSSAAFDPIDVNDARRRMGIV